MDEHNHDEQLLPEEEFEIAVQEIEKGNINHAIFHLSGALGAYPENREWLKLLDEIIDQSTTPLSLIKEEARQYADQAAIHAYILVKEGYYEEGLKLLTNVAYVKTDVSYLSWLKDWVEDTVISKDLPIAEINRFWVNYLSQMQQTEKGKIWAVEEIEDLKSIIETIFQRGEKDLDFLNFSSILLRRLGAVDMAMALAQRSYQLSPNYMGAVALAGIYREQNKLDQAIAAFKDAIKFKPNEIGARLDIGDILLDNGHLKESLQAYNEVLKIEPENRWALPSIYYLKYILENNNIWQEKLRELTVSQPDNDRAKALYYHLQPYIAYLPTPREATINVLQDLSQKDIKLAKNSTFNLTVSHLEAPSAMMALELYFAAYHLDIKTEIGVLKIPTPDPRYAYQHVDYLLWRYDGNRAIVAVDPPPKWMIEEISNIALQKYSLSEWSKQAAQLAKRFTGADIKHLLSVMVHPPLPNKIIPTWSWIQHIQVATALVIAHLDDRWQDSVRRQALLSLVYGPVDWVMEAAIIALTEIAQNDPEREKEIGQIFNQLLTRIPNEGYCCFLYPLICNWQRLPNNSSDLQIELKKWQQELERVDSEADAVAEKKFMKDSLGDTGSNESWWKRLIKKFLSVKNSVKGKNEEKMINKRER